MLAVPLKSKWLPRPATCCPTPCCEELSPSAGPECTSHRGPKIISMGADFCELLHFKHLDTRLHSSVTKGITPDILLTGMGECVGVHSSQSKEMLSIKRSYKFYWQFKWWERSDKKEIVTLPFFMLTKASYPQNLKKKLTLDELYSTLELYKYSM